MNKIFKIGVIGLISLLLSCDKNEGISKSIEDGVYSGTFTVSTVSYSSFKQSGATTITLKKGKYACAGNSNRVPAGGSGNFSINENKITFTDENFWYADFDWNLILNGTYDYTFDGKNLKISASKNEMGYYEYDLKKQ